MVAGKLLYSEMCLKKFSWDEKFPPDIEKKWKKMDSKFDKISSLTISRCVTENIIETPHFC